MHPAAASNPAVAGDVATLVGKMRDMEIHTPTPAGAAYVNKVTHPPSPRSPDYRGVPDCSSPNVVHLELKGEYNFSPVITRATAPNVITSTVVGKMLFLQTSSPQVGVYCWLADNGGWVQPQSQPANPDQQHPAIAQKCASASICKGYNFSNFADDVAQYRATYKSTTFYLNATDFNNQGTITCAKFKPSITAPVILAQYVSQLETDDEIDSVLDCLRVPRDEPDDDYIVLDKARARPPARVLIRGRERFAKYGAAVNNIWLQFWDISSPTARDVHCVLHPAF